MTDHPIGRELTDKEWGAVLSADQNGFFHPIDPGDPQLIADLIADGIFRPRSRADGKPPTARFVELTPLARSMMRR